jgi:anti-anti-sigma regulatory factor
MKQNSFNTRVMKNKKNKQSELKLSVPLVLKHAESVKADLLNAIEGNDEIVVMSADPLKLDIAGIQVLLAALHTASSMNKKLIFQADLNDETEQLLQHAGFGEFINLFKRPSIK